MKRWPPKIPVVSTTVGAEGLDIRHGEDIFLADTARDFAECCLTLLDDPAARRRLATTAREKVSTCYSWDVVARKFEALLVSSTEINVPGPLPEITAQIRP